jgi:lysophospholipase L1-like esterase
MRYLRRAVGAALAVALVELLLRLALLGYGRWGRANCGVRPELLGRLQFAYSRPRPLPGRDQAWQLADPNRGWRHHANLRDRTMWGSRISTNRFGMRGTNDYPVPKPAGRVRVAALGDSFTFGEGVPDDATWPAQLEAAVPGLEVMNLGERAYAHDQMYVALREDGLRLQPDAVILGFFHADLWRDEVSFYCAEKPRLTRAGARWELENVPVPTPRESHDRARRLPLVYAVPRILVEAILQPRQTNWSGADRATEALRRIRELTAAAGARFIMVNISDHPELPTSSSGFFADYCARTGAECVDPTPLFAQLAGTSDRRTLRDRYQRPNDVHYSRAGYAVVAEALRRHLAARPLTPASPPAARP